MVRVFIHKGTRVMRQATSDEEVLPGADEEAVEVTFPADLRHLGKYWKLSPDNKQMLEAAPQEIIDSKVDADLVDAERQKIVIEAQKIAADIALRGATLEKLTLYFNKLYQLRT